MAILGTILNCLTSLATSKVISASSSAVGLKFTVVSAKKQRPPFGEQQVHARDLFYAIIGTDDLYCRPDRIRIIAAQSADHTICLTGFHHHATKMISVFHRFIRFVPVYTPALAFCRKISHQTFFVISSISSSFGLMIGMPSRSMRIGSSNLLYLLFIS